MQPKIVKLPHLRASHVVNPLAATPEQPTPRVADEISSLSGLWSTAVTEEADPLMGSPTEVSLDDLWEGGLEAARAVTAAEGGADVDTEGPRGPRPTGRSPRFRVDRPPTRRETAEDFSRAMQASRDARERFVTPQAPAPPPPPPERPLTPMQRAAQYTDRTANYKRLLRGE